MIHHQINMFSTICIFFLQQPTWRYWGEEKVDGAIFTVYLKKVRYHTPTKSVSVVSNNKSTCINYVNIYNPKLMFICKPIEPMPYLYILSNWYLINLSHVI